MLDNPRIRFKYSNFEEWMRMSENLESDADVEHQQGSTGV